MSNALQWSRMLRRLAAAAVPLLALAVTAGPIEAQGVTGLPPKKPAEPEVQPGVVRRGFQLFANADIAGAGMKMPGSFGWGVSNLGPCADAFSLFSSGSNGQGCGAVLLDGQWSFHLYDLGLVAGAGETEFNKIKAVRPEAATSLRGQPFSQIWVQTTSSPRQEFGPADNTLGRLFSGVASTSDGSCRDHTGNQNADMNPGVTLLATSDCPATWASGGFQGPRVISDSAYLRLREIEGSQNFSFDYWRAAPLSSEQGFLGDYSTYGRISDHYAEMVAQYGGVTKLGTGAAVIGGFPLGLEIDFQAYRFARPTLQNVVFWQMTVVNRSDRLYGSGIAYDSLYMGLTYSMGGVQETSVYYEPQRGAMLSAEPGTSQPSLCHLPTLPTTNCGSDYGFGNGPIGWLMLKSPIGDLRNKLLSRQGTPFYDESSPFRDDTITFNHAHTCGYNSCSFQTSYANDRRGFGMVSSNPQHVLDGRTTTQLTSGQYWYIFRNKNWPTSRPEAFQTFVPGSTPGFGQWDYDNDGQADTLFLDTCDNDGCVTTWADTMPGRQLNYYGNDAAMMTAGPFKLGIGDTTSFVFAFVGAPDSASFEGYVDNAIDAYTNFFRIPQPPPPCRVASTAVEAASTGDPRTRLFFTCPAQDYIDPYLQSFAASLRAGAPDDRRVLNTLNPWLADSVEARAADNLDQILVFKSCDNGQTWTDDADCVGDPIIPTSGLGWLPYTVLTRDAVTGRLPNTFSDPNVIGGRTYLYSFVAVSRGYSAAVRDSAGGTEVTRVLEVAPSVSGSIERSGTTTARVYVPINLAAGTRPTTFALSTTSGFESGVNLTVRVGQTAPSGNYRLLFSDRFIVTRRSTDNGDSTIVVAQDVVPEARVGGRDTTDVVVSSDTFRVRGTVPVQTGEGTTVTSNTRTAGDTTIVTDTITGFGFVAVAQDNRPLFITTNLVANSTTPEAFLSAPGYPGILVSTDASTAFEYATSEEGIITPTGDSTTAASTLSAAPNFRADSSTIADGGFGRYQVRWRGDAYGPNAPFTIAFGVDCERSGPEGIAGVAVARGEATGEHHAGRALRERSVAGEGAGTRPRQRRGVDLVPLPHGGEEAADAKAERVGGGHLQVRSLHLHPALLLAPGEGLAAHTGRLDLGEIA